MERTLPSSLTIEEAVAEMVNMDYIPAGFTLLEMVAAFQEVAEVEYENACIDRLPEDQITSLKFRMDSCLARLTLAELLLESLQYEVKNPENSLIVIADDASSHQRLTRDSVWEWAADRFGIGISLWSKDPKPVNEKLKDVSWENITIKIYKNHKIGFSYEKGKFTMSHFREIGLWDNRTKSGPDKQGNILIYLSIKESFHAGKYIERKEVTAMSKLRKVLRKWIGLSDDPFMRCNSSDGWKPRFTLIDDRKNADERAKNKAIHVPYDESKKYGDDADD